MNWIIGVVIFLIYWRLMLAPTVWYYTKLNEVFAWAWWFRPEEKIDGEEMFVTAITAPFFPLVISLTAIVWTFCAVVMKPFSNINKAREGNDV